MKLVRTFGRTKKTAAALIETLERRGASNTSRVAPIVTRIVADVRERGGAALREYATKFDRLSPNTPLLVSQAEMQTAWEATSPNLQAAMRKYPNAFVQSMIAAQGGNMPGNGGPKPHIDIKVGPQIVINNPIELPGK